MNSRQQPADLLALWARTVEDVERGYPLTYDDYLNDLDVRHALLAHESLPQLAALDARFRAQTYPSGECVWGEENAAAEAWDREANWYYWRLPKNPGMSFDEEEL